MDSKQTLVPAYVLSAIVVVAAVLGSLVLMETATVKLVVPASKLLANVTLKGGPPGHDLVTTTISAEVTDSMQGTASTTPVPATFASGLIVFTCSPCSANAMPIPVGTTVSTAAGVHYTIQPNDPCGSAGPCGPMTIVPPHTSVQVQAHAVVAGKAGNAAANTVTVIDKPIPNVKVTNPLPISGGADATTTPVIQQADLDRAQLGLTSKVTQDLDAALRAQAGGLAYLGDAQPSIKLTSDHKVGDHVDSFTMTATATQSATAFSQAQADAILHTALNQKLPKGFALTADPIQTSYMVAKPTGASDVTITATGIGVMVPNVTPGELKARIRGMQIDAARKQLQLLAPGTTVDISIKPAVPWLPVLQDHINLTYIVVTPT